jgi:Bacterial sugar transferase/CoA-binding domain
MANPTITEQPTEEREATTLALPERDVRRKRPPALAFLLKADTLRRIFRVAVLLVLDYGGVSLAIFTALILKAALLDEVDVQAALNETEDVVSFAYLVTVLLFARSQLYADRAVRPGFTKIITALFQVTVLSLVFALVNGEQFQSYYIFYGSLIFAAIYVSALRFAYEAVTGALLRAAGFRRRAVLVGSGTHIDQVGHALSDATHSPVEVVGFVSLTPRPADGLRSLGTLSEIDTVLAEHRIQEVIIADPDFPQAEAVELVDICHRTGVNVRIAPSTMEILVHRAEFVPGQSLPLFELRPPVFEGIDFAMKRTFDLVGSVVLLVLASPVLAGIGVAVRLSSRGPILYRSARPGIGGVPFSCFKFRTMRSDADQL